MRLDLARENISPAAVLLLEHSHHVVVEVLTCLGRDTAQVAERRRDVFLIGADFDLGAEHVLLRAGKQPSTHPCLFAFRHWILLIGLYR